jgi:hypothetical protein
VSLQDTDIQTFASDIRDIIELIEEALDTRSFDENAADAAREKELDDIANRLWKIKTKLRAEE